MKTVYWSTINSTRTQDGVYFPNTRVPDSQIPGFDICPLAYREPEVLKASLPEAIQGMNYLKCPAFTEASRNTYALRLPLDYNISIDIPNGKASSDNHDQAFFNYLLSLRELDRGIVQIAIPYMFLCKDSLDMSTFHPYLHSNNITKSGSLLGGQFDIGKWARPTNLALMLHGDTTELNLVKDDVYSYVKFHTNEKVVLKRFDYSQAVDLLVNDCLVLKHLVKGVVPLKSCYEAYLKYNYHKKIIKEVRKNLSEG